MKKSLLADLILLCVAIAWGYTFVLSKDLMEEITPLYFIGTRFLIAALLLLVFTYKHLQRMTAYDLWTGILAGVALGAAFNLQIFGIDLTTPGKAGLFTGTTVVWIPILYYVWKRKPISFAAVFGTAIIAIGLVLFAWNSGFDFSGLNAGDFLVLLGALFFAVHVIVVDHYHAKKKSLLPELVYVMMQLFVVGVLTLLLAIPFEPVPVNLSPYGWYAYWFDTLFGTLLAYVVQIYAQKYTHPAHVGIILSFEAVFAYVFSWWLWGENITLQIFIGIVLFILGILAAEMGHYSKTSMPLA